MDLDKHPSIAVTGIGFHPDFVIMSHEIRTDLIQNVATDITLTGNVFFFFCAPGPCSQEDQHRGHRQAPQRFGSGLRMLRKRRYLKFGFVAK